MDSAVVVVGHKLFKHSHADRVSDNIAAIAILTLALSTLPSLQQSNYKFRRLVRPFVRSFVRSSVRRDFLHHSIERH